MSLCEDSTGSVCQRCVQESCGGRDSGGRGFRTTGRSGFAASPWAGGFGRSAPAGGAGRGVTVPGAAPAGRACSGVRGAAVRGATGGAVPSVAGFVFGRGAAGADCALLPAAPAAGAGLEGRAGRSPVTAAGRAAVLGDFGAPIPANAEKSGTSVLGVASNEMPSGITGPDGARGMSIFGAFDGVPGTRTLSRGFRIAKKTPPAIAMHVTIPRIGSNIPPDFSSGAAGFFSAT